MKIKSFLIAIIISLMVSVTLSAQTIIWEDEFDSAAGWELNGNWSINGNMLNLEWYPEQTNYDMSAISPVISLPDNVGDLTLFQYIDQYEFSEEGEFFEIAVLNNGIVDVIWTHSTNEDWGEFGGTAYTASLTEYSGEDIQIRFRSAGGNTYNFNSWMIYRMYISGAYDDDLAAVDISCPNTPSIGASTPIIVTIKNVGVNTQNSYTVLLKDEDGTLINTETGDIPITAGDEVDYTLFWIPQNGGYHQIYGEVVLDGDDNLGNNLTELLQEYVPYQCDVAVLDLTYEAELVVGEESEFMLLIRNTGSITIPANDLILFLATEEGELLDYYSPFIGFLEPGDEMTYDLYYTPEFPGERIINAGVFYHLDQYPDDNQTDFFPIIVFNPNSTLVDIGPNYGWNTLPMYFNTKYCYTQMIYLEDELDETGFIDFIGFVYDFSDAVEDSKIKIYLGEIDLDYFTDEFMPTDDLDLVFDGYISFSSGLNNCYIMLDTPYFYSGGNLLLGIYREYNWHNTDGLRRFNGGFIDGEGRLLSTHSSDPIDLNDAGYAFPSTYQIRTKFVFNGTGVGNLTGTVTDPFNEPIENALISFPGGYKTALTAADGTFMITSIYSGVYAITVSKPGFVEQTVYNITIEDGLTADTEVSMVNSAMFNDPPANLTAETYNRNNVQLNWIPPMPGNNRELMGYHIYRDHMRVNYQPIADSDYLDQNLPVGIYQYYVTAFYDDGESIESNIQIVEVTDLYVPRITDIQITDDRLGNNIFWDIILRDDQERDRELRNLIGFNLYRNDELINDEPLTIEPPYHYEDHDLENLGIYQYAVSAVYTHGESDLSPMYEYQTLLPPHSAYGLPWGDYIELYWTAPPEPNNNGYLIGYNIYDVMAGDILINPEPITEESYLIAENIIPGDFYAFFITAVYNMGESLSSNIVNITAGDSGVNPPQNLVGTVNDSDILLTWQRPVGTGIWKHWDNNEPGYSFGIFQNQEFIAAIHFDEWDLMAYDYHKLAEVGFKTNDVSADYSLIIWRENLNFPEEGIEVVYEESLIDVEADSWNYVRLPSLGVLVNYQNQSRFTIGIRYSNYTGNPACFDGASNTSSKSDWIIIDDEITHLSDHDIDANWNIRLYLYPMEQVIPADFIQRTRNVRSDQRDVDLYLTGYNIYRNDVLINFVHHLHATYLDENLSDGSYDYYLIAVYEILEHDIYIESDASPIITLVIDTLNVDELINIPYVTALLGNYPNPFNPKTTISFSLKDDSRVKLEIYNIKGQKVKTLINSELERGEHRIVWNGTGENGQEVGSGLYFYKMTTKNYTQTNKMTIIK